MVLNAGNPVHAAAADYLSRLSMEERRQRGQVYTLPHIVDFVISQAGYDAKSSGPLLDPACGSGAFLEGAVRVLARATVGAGRPRSEFLVRVEDELFGVDVDEHACELSVDAVQRAVKEASHGPLRREFFMHNVVRGDFLVDRPVTTTCRAEFAFVIGNPPYVSATRIDPDRKAELRQRFSTATGRLDLYMIFIERAVRLLAPNGRIAMITPDKFLVSQSARTLRAFLLSSVSVCSIARFRSHKMFASVATVPCVTVLERSKARGDVELLQCENDASEHPTVRVTGRATVPHAMLTSQPWYLSTSDDLGLARKLQGKHSRLAQFTVRVSAGPATGRDSVFVFKRGSHPEIEEVLLRPAVRGRDVKAYAICDPGLEILVPYSYDDAGGLYDGSGGAALVDLERFPGAAGYLARHKAELDARHCVRIWEKSWYDLHDQPVGDLARQTKILVPDVANSNRFAVDEGRYFPLHSAYYLVPRSGVDPYFLVGILNSDIAAFFVRVFSPVVKDGFNRYRQQFLAEIPIPRASNAEERAIADAAKRRDPKAVNDLVAALFRLSSADGRRLRIDDPVR